MKIDTIEITNYKAFLGTHRLQVGGKNLFIYGENGSGKSSLYYALKDFFQSSIEDIDLTGLKNVFAAADENSDVAIKVAFKTEASRKNSKSEYQWTSSQVDARKADDTSIRDGNKLKSFLTYKHLLAIHHLKKDEEINLFDLLVKGVLKHFRYSLTRGKELGELFMPKSPEYILKHAQPFLDYFSHNVALELRFSQVRPNKDYSGIEGDQVHVELRYAGKEIEKAHLFLNEARLSAIAISIYLGMIKRHVQGIPCKVLFLDDIFIGLDIANRFPLLEILEKEFSDYQIFITTYDKPWFEYARGFLERNKNWKTMEFYAQRCKDGMEIPLVFDNQDLIGKAEGHLKNCDYKAAAVYTRSAFEKAIQKYCAENEKKVVFKPSLKNYTTEDFWKVLQADISQGAQDMIETSRSLVLNTFSHYNTERHEIKAELEAAIQALKTLKTLKTELRDITKARKARKK
ncbi:AAA family ATPase [Prosthecochloris vibrioformis]|uniref:ATP-binding protein n=1 Tax=Prosthecochloris vibrioformis TaxID=1098 RepID=A0A5C4RY99_PROVB|nr:AAA family ATPase [Prosthecochloris vibrioformis]TNJ35938.1 ATP-binding protein [Prosthecochloris vibrioformis]